MKCVGAPADGFRVLGIAAVDSAGNYVAFSSHGFINDSMIKPNIASQGKRTIAASSDGSFISTSGTSLSAPVITGAAACLWQAKPEAGWNRVLRVIEESSSQFNNPDTLVGFGIPDFSTALNLLSVQIYPATSTRVFPNPFLNELTIVFSSSVSGMMTVAFYDVLGQVVYYKKIPVRVGENSLFLADLEFLQAGFYIAVLDNGTDRSSLQLLNISR